MVTMEQLEQLEGRIVKALELISDLRVENNHLEGEVGRLNDSNKNLQITAEEKSRLAEDKAAEAERLQDQLEKATTELQDLKNREVALEQRINGIIAKLDHVKGETVKQYPKEEAEDATKPDASEDTQEEQVADINQENDKQIAESTDIESDDSDDDELVILDDDDAVESTATSDDEALGVFDDDDENDFLIVEEK